MITVQWRAVYMEGCARREVRVALTGNTYGDVFSAYIEKLSVFGHILESELVEYKEEKEGPLQDLLLEETF